MKTNIIAITGTSLLVLFVVGFASIFEIRLASAQVDATSSASSSMDVTTTPLVIQSSTSSTPIGDAASSTPEATAANDSPTTTVDTSAPPTSAPAVEPPPQGLTLVHIIGMRYFDYFTDGTTTVVVPGDPAIDSNFDKPNAQIPTHAGLKWDHSTGQHLYDTPSGDLEAGDYAVQSDGSYAENAPPFVSSTSTPAQLTPSIMNSTTTDTSSTPPSVASPSAPDASTSTLPSPSDNSSSTTTSSAPVVPTL